MNHAGIVIAYVLGSCINIVLYKHAVSVLSVVFVLVNALFVNAMKKRLHSTILQRSQIATEADGIDNSMRTHSKNIETHLKSQRLLSLGVAF